MIKNITFYFLCSLLGAVFIFSGYTKLYPIEPFEYTFVDIGISNWQTAPFIARFLIGLEFLIGFLLLFNINLRKTAYKLGISTLVIFCVYLVLLIFFSGNKGNCGCFGSYIQMTPLQALLKNIIMLALFIILYKYHNGWGIRYMVYGNKGIRKYALYSIPYTLYLVSFALPFILNPVALDYSEVYLNKPADNYALPLDSLYNDATLNVPPKTLSQNKHILVFMSLTCAHCKMAANKIRIMHERNPAIPFYFVLNGDKKDLKPFFENTQTEDIPHCMLLGRNFIYLAGLNLPVIFLVNNSVVEHDINYFILDQTEIEKWLAK